LSNRGYSTSAYETKNTAYYNKPTTYQKASYGSRMVEIVRRGDVEGMQKMMEMGLSPNPCNVYGESLVHMVRYDKKSTMDEFEFIKQLLNFKKSVFKQEECQFVGLTLDMLLSSWVFRSHPHLLFFIFSHPTHEQVCRRGDIDLLEVLVDAGVNLQVSDDYGRTVSDIVST
jgi:hypothetical protein